MKLSIILPQAGGRARRLIAIGAGVCALAVAGLAAEVEQGRPGQTTTLYAADFSPMRHGRGPDGWRDLIHRPPNRNWAVDGNGFVRPVLKLYTGLLVYDGATAGGTAAGELGDVRLTAEFKKTEDAEVAFDIVARVVDPENYYLARFLGVDRLEILKVKAGQTAPLDLARPNDDLPPRSPGVISLQRYREGQRWQLSLEAAGDRLTAVVRNGEGFEVARLSARDDEFKRGHVGLQATTFAAAATFRIDALQSVPITVTADQIRQGNAALAAATPDYPVLQPHWNTAELDTPSPKVAAAYDVVVAGAGTGGWAAAVQAARLGARVLLLEETDWIGGQMCAAGVTSMDEDSLWNKYPVRERGLYREFFESMILHYQTLDKDPFVAYYAYPEQLEPGFEPKVARAMLYAFIAEVRARGAVLDLATRAKVVAVRKESRTVTGATVAFVRPEATLRRDVACQVLIDATEYGDVIPLTGARYRVGNSTSDRIDPAALVQDHTWTAVVREYPGGVPEHLQIKTPPPGYEQGSGRRYRNYQASGLLVWGAAGKGIKGPRDWRVYFAWRGMVDTESTLTGMRSAARHTQCGFNGGNDYPVTAATIEDPAQRLRDEREGIYKTLGALYYFQQELGVNWSLAVDEGYDTPYQRAKIASLDLRPDLAALAVHLPQQPYVRECRRIIGVRTLAAADLTRFELAKHFSTSVAMGDYFMDLDHGKTAYAIEADLDQGSELPRGGGPFQIPFEVFIPEKIDGFLPAEKNISQSRLANGATRLQPVTMLSGQAAGAIAAVAVQQRVAPRAVNPVLVQRALLAAGATLMQRWYADVTWGTPLWQATQLLSLHGILDRPGPLEKKEGRLGENFRWGAAEPLAPAEREAAFARLAELTRDRSPAPAAPASVTRGEFALLLAEHLAANAVVRP